MNRADRQRKIKEFVQKIENVWLANPELRFGQLVYNLISAKDPFPELFYIPDPDLRERLDD